jgi:hypothetical protein
LIKILIIVLLIGVVLSLFSGLTFLFKDSERQDSKRTLYALGVRIILAVALLLTVFYGFYSGQLQIGANAPWHQQRHQQSSHHSNHPTNRPVDHSFNEEVNDFGNDQNT